jgi:hypothetical protein
MPTTPPAPTTIRQARTGTTTAALASRTSPVRSGPQRTGRPFVPLSVWLCPPEQQPADRLPPPLLDRLATALLTRRIPASRPTPPLIRTVTTPRDLAELPEWAALLTGGRVLVTVSRNSHGADGQLLDLAGATVAAATTAGLVYRQHLVLIETGRTDPKTTGSAHVDALLFTHPGARR